MKRLWTKLVVLGLAMEAALASVAQKFAPQGNVVAANTLTNLIGPMYAALDIVSRELVGAIPCATLDAQTSRAAVNQEVISFVTPSAEATDITPGVTPPDDGDQNIGNVSVKITKSRRVPFRWNGEEERALANTGTSPSAVRNDQLTQAIRTLVNEMERDVVLAARLQASRAYGTPGATPFATNLADPAQVRKILDDNGAPASDRCMVIDTAAGANLRTMGQLTKANEAGTTITMRDGELLNLHGMSIHESAGVTAVAVSAGTGYTTDASGYAVGATDIVVAGTVSGDIVAGEIIEFAGDTNKYVVTQGVTAAGQTLKIGGPGLRKAITGAVAITVLDDFTPNLAFSRSSLMLATRAPALPDGGDSAVDRMLITDPRSGITFEVAMYAQYRQMQYEVSAAWGAKGIKAAHGAILLG